LEISNHRGKSKGSHCETKKKEGNEYGHNSVAKKKEVQIIPNISGKKCNELYCPVTRGEKKRTTSEQGEVRCLGKGKLPLEKRGIESGGEKN